MLTASWQRWIHSCVRRPAAPERHFRSAPNNGHHLTGPVGPVGARSGPRQILESRSARGCAVPPSKSLGSKSKPLSALPNMSIYCGRATAVDCDLGCRYPGAGAWHEACRSGVGSRSWKARYAGRHIAARCGHMLHAMPSCEAPLRKYALPVASNRKAARKSAKA